MQVLPPFHLPLLRSSSPPLVATHTPTNLSPRPTHQVGTSSLNEARQGVHLGTQDLQESRQAGNRPFGDSTHSSFGGTCVKTKLLLICYICAGGLGPNCVCSLVGDSVSESTQGKFSIYFYKICFSYFKILSPR